LCQAISPTTDTIMLPTTIGAGAVAAAGMAPTTGARKSARTKSDPVTMAVTPVRPPAATPAADLQHRQRLGLRLHGVQPAEDLAR
jgi:hypothetical protein